MSVFDKIRPTTVRRSKFDLSHAKSFTMDMGQLIPILCKEVAPNDVWKIGNESVIRFLPMKSPALTSIHAYVHYFFVPTRYLMKDADGTWEGFISGMTKDKNPNSPTYGRPIPDVSTLPTWNPTSDTSRGANGLPSGSAMYSLWDYLGMPVGLKNFVKPPLAFGKRAYCKVYNDWYRENFYENEIDLDTDTIQFRNLKKDYFVSALPSPQLGDAPTLPIYGFLPLVTNLNYSLGAEWKNPYSSSVDALKVNSSGGVVSGGVPSGSTIKSSDSTRAVFADASAGLSADVNDLRVLYATQRFMERNNVAGGVDPSHYGDFLVSHWGIAPSDIELGRSQYIGGSKNPILIGEVAQTSESSSDSPQGSLSGSGMSAGRNFICNFRAKEFGYIIGILSIMPDISYYGGLEKQWLKHNKEEFLLPEFVDCGETAVWKQELKAYSSFNETSEDVFGYQGIYDEYRSAHDIVCGGMTSDFYSYWNLARTFSNVPELNKDFVSGKWLSTTLGKRIFNVQEDDTTKLDATRCIIVSFNNLCHVVRCLPYYPM